MEIEIPKIWRRAFNPIDLEQYDIIIDQFIERFIIEQLPQFLKEVKELAVEIYKTKTAQLPGDAFFDFGMDYRILQESYLKAARAVYISWEFETDN